MDISENVSGALMRLTMCARNECPICKYKDTCTPVKRQERATDNMRTVADALEAGHFD